MMGASVVGPRLLAAQFGDQTGATNFSPDEIALLDEIGETIIPATDVPGATAVGIGAFIAMMVRDCYQPRDQATFKTGLAELEKKFAAKYGKPFRAGAAADREVRGWAKASDHAPVWIELKDARKPARRASRARRR